MTFVLHVFHNEDLDSVVGVVTGYGLNGPGIELR
jgi:hypothetical protein